MNRRERRALYAEHSEPYWNVSWLSLWPTEGQYKRWIATMRKLDTLGTADYLKAKRRENRSTRRRLAPGSTARSRRLACQRVAQRLGREARMVVDQARRETIDDNQ